MTTTVIVQANHGWPVDVEMIPVRTNTPNGAFPVAGWKSRVPAGQTQQFCVHSGADLRITEVQPDELAAEAAAQPQAQEA